MKMSVKTAVIACADPRMCGMAFVPEVVQVLGGRLSKPASVKAAHDALYQAYLRDEIELRPESGLNRLSQEELKLCFPSEYAGLLSWIRPLWKDV